MPADDDVLAARTRRVEHRCSSRRRRALARADDRADGLHTGRPALRRGGQAELEGHPASTSRRTTPPRATSRSSSRRAASAARARTSRTPMGPPSRPVSRPSTGWTSVVVTRSGAPRRARRRSRCGTPSSARGHAAQRSSSRTVRSTPTNGSTCSSGSGPASSASLRPSTACSPTTPSSSASGHRDSDGSCRPATSSTRRSSLSSRSAGACRSRTATARPRRTSSSRISPTAR